MDWPNIIQFAIREENLDFISGLAFAGVDPQYAGRYFKHYVSLVELEELDLDISDIYEHIGSLMATPAPDTFTKRYWLPRGVSSECYLDIKEDRADISHGTTGLRTWQASLALVEYCASAGIRGQNVLELGSGAGFLGLALQKMANCVTLTDFSDRVLQRLFENAQLNNLPVAIQKLDWETPGQESPADLIIGADIVYDPEVVPLLVNALTCLAGPRTRCIIAHTMRRQETLDLFLEYLSKEFEIVQIAARQKFYFYSETSPVLIYSFLKHDSKPP